MQKIVLTAIFIMLCTCVRAQTWDGGGDGTSWNDAQNWGNDVLPSADSVVVFNTDATVTGTADVGPLQLRVAASTSLTLDLDLTVGDPGSGEHAVVMNDTASLVIGTIDAGRTLTLNAPDNKHALLIGGGAEMASITVAAGNTVTVIQGLTVLNMANQNSSFTNDGTILANASVKDGFRVSGTFTNNGIVSGGAIEKDLFNIKNGGQLINNLGGNITSLGAEDDGVEVTDGGTFTNAGSLLLVAADSAASANNPIQVAGGDNPGTFVNTGRDVTLNAGQKLDAGRALNIETGATATNTGTLRLVGGNEGNRLSVDGNFTNGLNGIVDLTDGRFNTGQTGTLINNGLIRTTRMGAGGFTSGTSVNNAFFDYATGGFSSGSNGTITDNGINLNNNSSRINARGNCEADIANAPYEYFVEGTSYATSSDTGRLIFAERSLTADSVLLVTTIPGVEITVFNICELAVMTNGVFSPSVAVRQLAVYPNPVSASGELTVDLRGLTSGETVFQVVDGNGRLVATYRLTGGRFSTLPLGQLRPGVYYLRSVSGSDAVGSRFLVGQ